MLRWCQAVRNTPATPNYILILVLLLLQYNESDFKDRKHILILLVLNTEYHDDVIKWKHFPRYWPFCAGNSPVNGEFRSQRPVTRSFDLFFDLRMNKRLSKQSRRRWFETPSRSVWRQSNIPKRLGQRHGCWCPSFLRCQLIRSKGVDFVR